LIDENFSLDLPADSRSLLRSGARTVQNGIVQNINDSGIARWDHEQGPGCLLN
jgi:hypothetical protein